jgi:hypothetical protein
MTNANIQYKEETDKVIKGGTGGKADTDTNGDHDPGSDASASDRSLKRAENKKTLVEKSEHYEFLIKLGTKFYDLPHVLKTAVNSAEWWSGLNACRIILEKQMSKLPAPDREENPEKRLGRLIGFAVKDDPQETGNEFGWKDQVLSLAALTKARDGVPKWRKIETAACSKPEPMRKPIISQPIDPPPADHNCNCELGWLQQDNDQIPCPNCERGRFWAKKMGLS